jgi:hypothetical protein
VRIKTENRDALNAIHEFLRFQIADHHTDDTTDLLMQRQQQLDR